MGELKVILLVIGLALMLIGLLGRAYWLLPLGALSLALAYVLVLFTIRK